VIRDAIFRGLHSHLLGAFEQGPGVGSRVLVGAARMRNNLPCGTRVATLFPLNFAGKQVQSINLFQTGLAENLIARLFPPRLR
jgi:hypothetical protein